MPDTFTPILNLFGDDKHAPGSPEYRRMAEEAAQDAIAEWLRGVDAHRMHLFEADGVECALECFPGHWGEESRWRWGRTKGGEPDEDESGENVLLLIALGCRLAPGVRSARRRAVLPPYAEGALSPDEIKVCARARAQENLGKLVLHPLG